MRRKNSEYTKQLNIKFNKEMYWTNSGPDMVRGVKQQYEQMKLSNLSPMQNMRRSASSMTCSPRSTSSHRQGRNESTPICYMRRTRSY
jgi:hypothetical protein